ncbi:MAG: hypothetical protein MJB14_23970 [Spirochaetes bacterium]|nr:hypothetical protein [Spirochaetota bacterium]
MDLVKDLGVNNGEISEKDRAKMIRYINLKLASLGWPTSNNTDQADLNLAYELIENYKEKNRLLSEHLCPVDQRIQDFLDGYLADTYLEKKPRLPSTTFILDRYGLARELALPPDKNEFVTDIVRSYRCYNGIVHNPKNDRRTTKGSFHVTDGGLPVPLDKKVVPKETFGIMLEKALNPPNELQEIPFTSNQEKKARGFVSLLLRPLVCPEVPGVISEKNMEVRFFVPGNLVANLDFVESIFGNAGDPMLPEHDSSLDPEHWTGHSGCVILATHLTKLTKKEVGLPNYKHATERQRRDGMCWTDPNELYNEGIPFKLTCRDERGVIVTLIADNYFGYCKKEVKTQIGYSANLFGLVEEEHAGGALAFPCYNLGVRFIPDSNLRAKGHSFAEITEFLGDAVDIKPEGYGIDKKFPSIIYLPEDSTIELGTQQAKWMKNGKEQILHVIPENVYVHPTGYKIRMEKHPGSPAWRLVGTVAEGMFCHKPCTVSGGGKSEISKSIWDSIYFGPVFIADFHKDLDLVEQIVNKDYSERYSNRFDPDKKARSILSTERSLGSVIKLFSPSKNHTQEYLEWLKTIPNRILALVFLVKRFYQPEWGDNWREHFSVDVINGEMGHEFKFHDRKLVGSYLRVGHKPDGSWWTCKLRQDFMPSDKVQMEDDITASIVLPVKRLANLNPHMKNESVKIAQNCEYRFFQRPDEAINRGFDKQAEADLASPNSFISNFEPMTVAEAKELVNQTISYHQYTKPMKKMVKKVAHSEKDIFFVSSAHPRILEDGTRSKNPRYLQVRPDLINPRSLYLAKLGMRLYRKIPASQPVLHNVVQAVLPGRRNNPADHKAGIRPLAVYGPIHYQELPELFMDFICSLTGKSPSTTGAGSEGALTKGPFNALVATSDLNNALLSFILTGYNGFTTAAGYIGSGYKVAHDVSLLIPEIWSRMNPVEQDPEMMINLHYLEKIDDFEYKGKTVLGSRLGYRITSEFLNAFLGRIFENPATVFNDELLQPEKQSMEDFVDGINNIVEAQERVAKSYIENESIAGAIPPLKALICIMVNGEYEGKKVSDSEIRDMFKRENVLKSDWYKERLKVKQDRVVARSEKNIQYLEGFLSNPKNKEEAQRLGIPNKLNEEKEKLKYFSGKEYLNSLIGTIGADPLYKE